MNGGLHGIVTSPMLGNPQGFYKKFMSLPYLSLTAYKWTFEIRATQQIALPFKEKTSCFLPIVFLSANMEELGP